jgi:hypothetical protein
MGYITTWPIKAENQPMRCTMDSKLFAGNGGTQPDTPPPVLEDVTDFGTHPFDALHLRAVKQAVTSLHKLVEKLESEDGNPDHVLVKHLLQARYAIESGPLAVLRKRRERTSGRAT